MAEVFDDECANIVAASASDSGQISTLHEFWPCPIRSTALLVVENTSRSQNLGQLEWTFEAGFGRYVTITGVELRRALGLGGQTVHVLEGLQASKEQRGHCIS